MSDTPAPTNTQTTERATSTEKLANGERAEGELAKDQGKTPPKPKQFIDIDGEKVDVEEIKRDRKKYKSADDKFREAANARKEVEQFYEKLMEDPESILSDPRIPLKKRELAEKWLTEHLQEELKTVDPRDKEAADMKAKLKKYEDQEAEQKTKAEQDEYKKVVDKRREEIGNVLSKAMELSPLSKDPDVAAATLKEMASYLRMCRDAKYQVTPEEIVQHVEGQKMKSYQALAGRLEGDELFSFLGDGVVKKLIAHHLGKIQKAREVPAPDTADTWEPRGNKEKREFVDTNDLRRRNR